MKIIAKDPTNGSIIEIQRWSVADGPGSRTVVFLKGCPLHCPWCANPESQQRKPQIGIFTSRCVSCQACVRDCPEGIAIPASDGAFGQGNCTQCGRCIDTCHAEARTWMGEELSVDAVIESVKKDMVFYRRSSGGVTFSGGEPLTQPRFLKELLIKCKNLGIHTAVETCGCFNWEAAEESIRLLDFIMFDIKHMDTSEHKKFTGAPNDLILKNARKIANLNIPLVIRIPVIPSINDSPENILATAEFVRDHLPTAIGIEALAYHRLGLNKYAALGLDYKLSHITPPEESHMAKLRAIITGAGVVSVTAENNYDAQLVHSGLKIAG